MYSTELDELFTIKYVALDRGAMKSTEVIRDYRTELLFRQATPDDLEVVSFLLRDLGYLFDPAQIGNIFARLLSDSQAKILLAVSGQQVVGMVNLRSHRALRLNGSQVTIEELVVHPNFRGQGIGKELIAAAYQYAEVVGAVRIEVQTSNTRESFKRGFYDKNGFARAQSTLYRKDIGS